MLTKYQLLLLCLVFVSAASFTLTTYTYKTVGGVNIQLDVYVPDTAAPATGYPVFFAIHGGAYIYGSKATGLTGQEGAEVLSRGWVLVSINYRLIPTAFLPDIFEDVQDAYTWVRTQLVNYTPINPNLITVCGQSAGGGLAVVSGYKLTPRPTAIVAFYPGLTNWTDPLVYNTGTPVDSRLVDAANQLSTPVLTEYVPTSYDGVVFQLYYGAVNFAKLGWLAVTHDPNMPSADVLAILTEYSATENIDSSYPPTYLIHGNADETVTWWQSQELAGELAENNIPYVFALVDGAGHGFDTDPSYWTQYVYPIFNWVDQYM